MLVPSNIAAGRPLRTLLLRRSAPSGSGRLRGRFPAESRLRRTAEVDTRTTHRLGQVQRKCRLRGIDIRRSEALRVRRPDLGVPYIIKGVTVGDATNSPVLTIEPGTEIRFRKTGSLAAGNNGRTKPGRFVADGSAGRMIFTSMATSPAPGDFYGVSVYEGSSAESEFRNCDFSYGGGSGGDNGLLYVHKSNPVITGCDFGYSAGYGTTFQTTVRPDTLAIKLVNTFHDNASGTIKWLMPLPGH